MIFIINNFDANLTSPGGTATGRSEIPPNRGVPGVRRIFIINNFDAKIVDN